MPPLDVCNPSSPALARSNPLSPSEALMHDIEAKNYVAKQTNAGETIQNIIQYNYSRGQTPVKIAIKEGRFY